MRSMSATAAAVDAESYLGDDAVPQVAFDAASPVEVRMMEIAWADAKAKLAIALAILETQAVQP